MRVAIDARELHGQPTGVGRYLAGILAAWDRLPDARSHEFVLCAPDRAGSGGTVWEQATLPRLVREANAEVLFSPAYSGPLFCSVPMVVAIYDVSFAAHPEWFTWREGTRRRLLTRLAARRAARVITTSEFSKREITQRLRVPSSKIEVIYPGMDAGAARAFTAREADHQGPPRTDRESLVLYVGSLFTRRHIPELIEGFARLARRRDDVRLDIVGDNRTTPRIDFDRAVRTAGVADRITLRSYVPDEALTALYQRARAFVFLSEYEGFGLTPLEALAAGVPIVVLDTPIAREVYGDAAMYVASPDPSLVEAALERVLADETERRRILDAAAQLLPRYSWDACARQVLHVLQTCVR